MCRYVFLGTLKSHGPKELGHDEIVRFLTTNASTRKRRRTLQAPNTVALRKGVNAKASVCGLTPRACSSAAPRIRGAADFVLRYLPPPDPPPLAAHGPSRYRDQQPGERRADEGAWDAAFHYHRKHDRKGQHAEGAEHGAGGVQRGRLLSASPAVEARLAACGRIFMLFYQGRARAEDDGRKGQKQTADGCST